MKLDKIPSESVLEKMESLFSVAADFTRLKILFSLIDGEKCVSDIVVETDASQSLVSHQLRVLKDENLVATKKVGTKIFYSLDDDHVEKLINMAFEHVTEQ